MVFVLNIFYGVSLECNQIFRIGLGVMKHDKHAGGGHIVHHTVIQLNAPFGWWSDHVLPSKGVVSCQHSAEVHELLSILIRLGVGVTGGVIGLDSKVGTFAITGS